MTIYPTQIPREDVPVEADPEPPALRALHRLPRKVDPFGIEQALLDAAADEDDDTLAAWMLGLTLEEARDILALVDAATMEHSRRMKRAERLASDIRSTLRAVGGDAEALEF